MRTSFVADGSARARSRAWGTDGAIAGHVYARSIDEGVLLKVVATDLPPGEHAIHVHETGQCEAPGFESAGGHFNPSNQEDSLLREGGTSVVVHAKPDDNRTDPAGAAGPRIACGVFARALLDS